MMEQYLKRCMAAIAIIPHLETSRREVYFLKILMSGYSTVFKIANTFKNVSTVHHDGAAVTKKWLAKLLHKNSDN